MYLRIPFSILCCVHDLCCIFSSPLRGALLFPLIVPPAGRSAPFKHSGSRGHEPSISSNARLARALHSAPTSSVRIGPLCETQPAVAVLALAPLCAHWAAPSTSPRVNQGTLGQLGEALAALRAVLCPLRFAPPSSVCHKLALRHTQQFLGPDTPLHTTPANISKSTPDASTFHVPVPYTPCISSRLSLPLADVRTRPHHVHLCHLPQTSRLLTLSTRWTTIGKAHDEAKYSAAPERTPLAPHERRRQDTEPHRLPKVENARHPLS